VTWIISTTWCSWTCHIVLNSWSCVPVTWWLWYMTLLIQGASCSLYTYHSIHTWPYFTWSCVPLFSLVSYLSVYITVRFIIHSFQCSTYIVLYFHIFILLLPLLVCALAGPLLTDLDISASELEETDESLFEGTKEDYQAWVRRFLSYVFLHFVLLWCPDAKIVSSFISALLCSKSCIQIKTIVDVCLLCEMKHLVVFCTCVWEFASFRICLLYYSIRYSRERFSS